jgi:hypothetical protein
MTSRQKREGIEGELRRTDEHVVVASVRYHATLKPYPIDDAQKRDMCNYIIFSSTRDETFHQKFE